MIGLIVGGILLVIILFIIFAYNNLVALRLKVDNGFAQIDVQLKRRFDLIPNLIETVKGYAKHEKTVFESVTKTRTAFLNAQTTEEKLNASNMLTSALKSIFAVAENYPQLRASENFKHLQEELSDTESKVSYARQFYNDSVQDYNTQIAVFPNNLLAGMFGFQGKTFFGANEEERKTVKVQF